MAITSLALVVAATSGCFSRKNKSAAQQPTPTFTIKSTGGNTNVLITPVTSPVGRVFSVNAQAKFVVVTFPVGQQLPANDTRFSVFRGSAKVGEIKITIPPEPIGNGVSADIIVGTAEKGDEVRTE